jgi:hypothetical protein
MSWAAQLRTGAVIAEQKKPNIKIPKVLKFVVIEIWLNAAVEATLGVADPNGFTADTDVVAIKAGH